MLRGGEDVPGSIPVGSQELGLVPRGDDPGDMVDHVLAGGGARQSRGIVQVSCHHSHTLRGQRFRLSRRARQRGDFMPPAEEGVGQVAADEAGGAGDQRLHMVRSYSR